MNIKCLAPCLEHSLYSVNVRWYYHTPFIIIVIIVLLNFHTNPNRQTSSLGKVNEERVISLLSERVNLPPGHWIPLSGHLSSSGPRLTPESVATCPPWGHPPPTRPASAEAAGCSFPSGYQGPGTPPRNAQPPSHGPDRRWSPSSFPSWESF